LQIRQLNAKKRQLENKLKIADLQADIDELDEQLRGPPEEEQPINFQDFLFKLMTNQPTTALNAASPDGLAFQQQTPPVQPGQDFDFTNLIHQINAAPAPVVKVMAKKLIENKGLSIDEARTALEKVLKAIK